MEVRLFPGHGRAAFASVRHAAGSVLLREAPFLVWSGHIDTLALFASCLAAFAALPASRRADAVAHFAAPRTGTVVELEVRRAAEALVPQVNAAARKDMRRGNAAAPDSDVLDVDTAAVLLGIAAINNHAYGPGRAALFWEGAMVSHGCVPNVRYTSSDAGLAYTAIRDIEPGELLTYCYLPLDWLLRPTRDRAHRLLLEYDFVCDCQRCTGPDWCRGFPCAACAGTDGDAAAAADSAELGRDRHTFPTETPFLAALANAPRELLLGIDLHGPSAWRCTRCGSTDGPTAETLAREAHWRARWNVLDGPLEAGAQPATEPRGPTPLDAVAFRAELDAVQHDLGRIHYLPAIWHRMLAETFMLTSPTLAWAEASRVAAFCGGVLDSPFLVHALRGPYLIRLADVLGPVATLPARPTIADVRPTWLHWATSLRPADRANVQGLVQRLAALAGCAKCGQGGVGVQLQTCSRCHAVAYCSRDCQKTHWKAHKPTCLPDAGSK